MESRLSRTKGSYSTVSDDSMYEVIQSVRKMDVVLGSNAKINHLQVTTNQISK